MLLELPLFDAIALGVEQQVAFAPYLPMCLVEAMRKDLASHLEWDWSGNEEKKRERERERERV